MKYYELGNLYKENIELNDLITILNNDDTLEYYVILHDKDINKDTGEFKKAHYHCFIGFNDYGRYTSDKVKEYYKILTKNIVNVKSIKKAVQYLIHKNDKNKYQYEIDEIITNNRDKMYDLIKDTKKEINDILEIVIEKIQSYEYKNLNDIMEYFKQCHKLQYFVSHYYYISKLFDDIQRNMLYSDRIADHINNIIHNYDEQ